MSFLFYEADVVVVGGGHAGIEASIASSKLECKTIIITMSLDSVANMPCNPSIGGTAKGQLVKELDALGGCMGKVADETAIHSRILNRKKGPAVQSLRQQIDRNAYHMKMKNVLENSKNLKILQDEVIEICLKNGKVCSVLTKFGLKINTKSVVVACGTFLGSKIFVGDVINNLGPDGSCSSNKLADCLKNIGVNLRRFKTGTSARIRKSSIDFSRLRVQKGDEKIVGFSFENETILKNQVDCFVASTNEKTHEIILENLNRSPLYGGKIKGIGPRYCPSIEDKVVRFKDKTSHQFFIEPLGLNSGEMYLQGLSTSLPFDVQLKFLKTIDGLQDVEIMRAAYAIEYYCCDSLDLFATLEHKKIEGFFGAGQFIGTSGYEEAAVLGFVAGVNAALKVLGKEPLMLSRASSFIGTLIDDLVTKGCDEPYRMMTARSENRLILRQDNADFRLTETGHRLGLVDDRAYEKFCKKQQQIANELERIKNVMIKPNEVLNEKFLEKGTTIISEPQKFVSLLKRPGIGYFDLIDFDESEDKPKLSISQVERIEVEVKYEGYVLKQQKRIEQIFKLESLRLPPDTDYFKIEGLKIEARQQLNRIRPASLGQASRIFGVNPSDVTVLLVWLKQNRKI